MTEKVISLGDHTGDNRMISVEQMLEKVLAEIRAGTLKVSKAILIMDDNNEHAYEVWFANMSRAEAVVATAVVQQRNIERMRGIE